jgi:hypothetical protein
VPAAEVVPQWWKDMAAYFPTKNYQEGKKFFLQDRVANTSFKKCTPMLDALTSGYIIPLWTDVLVKQYDNGPSISWRVHQDVFELHGPTSEKVERPEGFCPTPFKYLGGWIPETPKGYSVLVSHPFGYAASPFHAVPAVIDSDRSKLAMLNPMWIRKDFEGVIEKGTPLVQITPFKREDWEAEYTFYEQGKYLEVEETNFNSTLISNYIKNHWSKKTYK